MRLPSLEPGCFCEPMKAFPIVLRKNLWMAALLQALPRLEWSVKLRAGPLGCTWGFPLLYSNYWLMERIDTRYMYIYIYIRMCFRKVLHLQTLRAFRQAHSG